MTPRRIPLLIHFLSIFTGDCVASVEKTLIRKLLRKYEELGTIGRPVEKVNDPITVDFGLSLIQIMDIDEKNQILTTNVWINYGWKDNILVWDPKEYDNITSVRVPADKIWTPDIKLYNYADVRLSELRDAYIVVYNDGTILWVPQAIFKSSCKIDITEFPFDYQNCSMKFGSWTYNGLFVDLNFFFENDTGLDFTDYVPSNEWEIIDWVSKKNIKRYTCCKETYIDLSFFLLLRRKVAFYNYILILPCILLSSLTLVLFWLPPESPAKMQLGMNIFVAFFVLLLLLAESTPPAASNIPLIGAYYCLNMVLITLSTCLSVIVVNIYFHGTHTRVPSCVKTVMLDYVARILFMKKLATSMAKLTQTKSVARTIYTFEQSRDQKVKANDNLRLLTNGSFPVKSDGTSRDSMTGPEPPEYSDETTDKLERSVRDIRTLLNRIYDKINARETKQHIDTEWKILALIVDRVFFVFYFICIVVSGAAIFTKTANAAPKY